MKKISYLLIGFVLLFSTYVSAKPKNQCLVLFEGKENSKKTVDLSLSFVEKPVKVKDSQVNDKWLWLVVLSDNDCTKAVTMPGYVGKSMNDFLKLSDTQKARFLKVRGICKQDDGSERSCVVPYGDKKVDSHGVVFFPHVNRVKKAKLRYPFYKDGKQVPVNELRLMFQGT